MSDIAARLTSTRGSVTDRLTATALSAQHGIVASANRRLANRTDSFAAVWVVVVIIGIFVIAAAALAAYCIAHGRNGAYLDYTTMIVKKWGVPVGIRVSILCA
jgi:hypothetical protein